MITKKNYMRMKDAFAKRNQKREERNARIMRKHAREERKKLKSQGASAKEIQERLIELDLIPDVRVKPKVKIETKTKKEYLDITSPKE